MKVIDIRDQLERAAFSYGKRGPNTMIVIHWNGGPVAAQSDPVEVLKADARFHVQTRGWDGISYHRAYWRDGTCYITRDWDDTLAASGDEMGNADGSHWQLMIGTGQSPTPEMLAAVARDIRAELAAAPLEVKPHRDLSATACPGDELARWVKDRGWEQVPNEDAVPRAEFEAYKREVAQTFEALKKVDDRIAKALRAAADAIESV